jgi:hypothetical protein
MPSLGRRASFLRLGLLFALLTRIIGGVVRERPLSEILGATHWAPCYFIDDSLPSILDGAVQLAAMGTRGP